MKLPVFPRLPWLVLVALLPLSTPNAVMIEPLPPNAALEALAAGKGRLVQEEHMLRLLDADGAERAALPVRGEHLDARVDRGRMLAVTMDADTQRVLIVDIDLARMQWTQREPLAISGLVVETLCLYRDAQRIDHLFVVGKDGQSEQWVLGKARPALLRRLALPPQVEHCAVDDAAGLLYVSEPDLGVWAYDAGGEGVPRREPVALRKPFGPLSGGAGVLAVIPGGVAVVDADGDYIHLLRAERGNWLATSRERVARNRRIEQLVAQTSTRGITFLLAADSGERWSTQEARWSTDRVAPEPSLPVIVAHAQTDPVARLGDAADDPAIWVHPLDARRSRVLGTNKKQGLLVYDLAGRELDKLEVGRLNNVDLRQHVVIDGEAFDLAVATHRDDLSLVVFAIDSHGKIVEIHRIPTGLKDIYGLCLFAPPAGGLQAIANDKDGTFLQFRLERSAGRWGSSLLRRFKLATQPEGCVADDARGRLFVGEEKRGLWVLSADGGRPARPELVLAVGGALQADVEGMAIYHDPAHSYLVVSSQGNSSYVVVDALPPYRVRGAFRIGLDPDNAIDGTSDTDGLEVVSANLGGTYVRGLLVVQDGYKRMPDGPQNFKYVAWEAVARVLRLP